jgi:hypothetical protein
MEEEIKMENLSSLGKFKFVLFSALFIIVGSLASYFLLTNAKNKQAAVSTVNKTPEIPKKEELITGFATYKEVPVNVKPQIAAYKIDASLANVTNKDDFELEDKAKNMLVTNAFVVQPGWEREFFSLYESNRYKYTPNFVTTDSIVHNYHLYFDYLLRTLEEEKLIPELKNLNSLMLTTSLEYYNQLKGTSFETAAKRNVGFFAVGSKLLDASVPIPDMVKDKVEQELALIEAHAGISYSPLWGAEGATPSPGGLKEDYSQYIPRGHYTKSEALKSYFKSMMWYGRLSFRLKDDDEIKSALLITSILATKDNIFKSWDNLYQPITFMVGKSDDIDYFQTKTILAKIYGQTPDTKTLQDKDKLAAFTDELKKLEPPKINSMPIFAASIQPNREEEIKAFRFFGQRFTIDASIFQKLICRDVGNKHGTMDCPTEDSRMLPKGLDIPAAMGSKEAYTILSSLGETGYKNYPENMAKMKEYIAGLKQDIWTQNLYWGWLYSLLPLTTEKPEGYPTFMRNTAWVRKELNTYLGSWAELKHDTILYAKQVYAELGGGGPIDQKDDKGYVEPNPHLYARLASLLKMTKEGLSSRGFLSDQNKDNLEKMEQLTLSLKTIAEKELQNSSLSDDEYTLIRTYGGQLEHFWLEVNKNDIDKSGIGQRQYLDQNPAALVADVATDPNGQVLEEGVGNIFEIYAVVPVEGKLKLAKGGVFSYYEFPWDLSDRLTDEKWREMINTNKAPKLPSWTDMFIAE